MESPCEDTIFATIRWRPKDHKRRADSRRPSVKRRSQCAVRHLRSLASSRIFGSTAVLVAALALTFAYAWPEQPAGWNARAHFALVRSLAHGTAKIDAYRDETGDVAWYRGHYYAAKAPGLALYSIPFWEVLRPIHQISQAGDRAIWALNFLANVVPAVVLFLLVRGVGDRLAPGTGLLSAIALSLGTMVLPFATMYFSHIPAATAAFAAFALLVRERDGPFRTRTVFVAGLLAGVAVVFEYPTALVGLVLTAYVLGVSPRLARGVAYATGAAIGIVPLIAYQWIVYGSPLHTPYDDVVAVAGRSGHDVVGPNGKGILGVTIPSFSNAVRLLVDDRGLLVLSPLVLAGVLGLVLIWRAGRRAESLTCLAIGAAFLVYNSGYRPVFGGIFAGGTPGPRLLLTCLPFLMLGAGPVWRRAPLAVSALIVASTAIFAAATVTYPRIGKEGTGPWTWWEYVRKSSFIDTLMVELGGPHGWLSVAPFVVALSTVLAVGIWTGRQRVSRSQAAIAVAAIFGWALLLTAAFLKAM